MKKRKKKHVLFIVLGIVIPILAVFMYNKTKTYNFSEITKVDTKEIVSVKTEYEQIDYKKILSKYENARYKKYSGTLGNTRREIYHFIDKDGKELFSMTDCGNALNVISISVHGNEKTYQYSK